MKPKLERWVQYGNCLVGYIFDSKFPPGTRVMTAHLVELDILNSEARCGDGEYKLGESGTQEEHNRPLLG